ncbi:type 1 phosphatidylinositol 4,5-bisphosphate 4-phosphatase-like [Mugil cephalus]|uniref:type 1 phosphatidylinositol 4,5-bisphosphate 4-phosphatase-like n=1 Tax=Mugil cephalus TaxID=48193 RepID=UPI001FB5E08C|nr:type 1 phosphatidylinositol 4,5-bisphosphate 4-phosphatase-like [Mugil cephalus]
MADAEKAPLLSGGGAVDGVASEADGSPEAASAPPFQDLPPPYSPVAADASSWVKCGVCHSHINVNPQSYQHLVKCPACNEATPLKNPPAGKKYVRCPCNCLLICKATSQRVACPRPNCKRIIELGVIGFGSVANAPLQPTGFRVNCGHCSQVFVWTNVANRFRVRCPHCRKVSCVGRRYPWRRFLYFFMLGLFFAGIVGTLAGCTWQDARENGAIYITWVVLIVMCIVSLGWSVYWVRIKISEPIQNYT